MPSNIVQKYSKETGKSTKEVEKLWDKAKKIASEMGKADDYAYITGVLQNSLGLDEATFSKEFNKFVWDLYKESSIAEWKTFIETMVSGSFSVTPEVVNPKLDDEEEDEEEDC